MVPVTPKTAAAVGRLTPGNPPATKSPWSTCSTGCCTGWCVGELTLDRRVDLVHISLRALISSVRPDLFDHRGEEGPRDSSQAW